MKQRAAKAEKRRAWSSEEIKNLKKLCAPYRYLKTIPWKNVVYPAFKGLQGNERIQSALVAK